MDTQIKEEWVAALRSGKYKQGKGGLRMIVDGEDLHCCLGVLCDIVDPNWVEDEERSDERYKVYGIETPLDSESNNTYKEIGVLPQYITRIVGLNAVTPNVYMGSVKKSLAALNDTGFTFEQIADAIEKSL